MKTPQSIITEQESETIYELMLEYFGSMKADLVYHEEAHLLY